MKKISVAAFVVLSVLVVSTSLAFAAEADPTTGNGFTVIGTPRFVPYSGEVDSASALAAILAQLTSPEQALDYKSAYNSSDSVIFWPNYVVNIKYNATHGVYGIYLKDSSHSGWLHTGNNKSGRYMVYCPSEKFEPDLLYSISRSASTINTKIDTISDNITQLMASNGYLASINNKLASLTSIGTKLDTISDLLNANTYCCGYITNSSGAEFPTQSISFSIAEQIVARLNSEMQGKNLTVLKRDGSGTTTSTFRRAYVTSSSMICLVMSGGTYYLCDSTNTIFKAGSDRLSNIYSKVNSMATTLTNIAGYIDTVESKLSSLATKLDTLHTDNSTIVGGIDTVSAKISGVISKLDTLHTDAASVISAIKALPDYSDKLDTITKLLTTNTYTCGYLTDAGGTAYKTIPISYDSAEAIVARLNTQLPGKQITYLPREGAPYASDFDYCALDSSLYIRVYSGQYSYYLCDSGNRLYRASADRVNVIDARLIGINNVLVSLGQKLDKLPTSYPLPDLTTIESAALGLESMVGSTYEIMSDLKARLDGLEVIVVGGEPTDLTTIESGISSLGKKLDKLPTSYPVPDLTGIESGISTLGGKLDTLHVDASDLIAAITGQSGASADLTVVTDRLDRIITLMEATDGVYSCDHTYSQDMAQEATCGLPGLMVSTCSKCGNSYSEIVSALGHDWKCTEHVEDETDPETGEITKAGYDIYTCTRCGETYEDHSGNGAPADYGDTSISKIIVSLFAKLGTFAGKVVSWIINLFDKALGSLDTLITRFSELTGQITSVGGDYPSWLSGFWAVLPEELQLVLTFAFICIFVGVVGRKLFFV